MVCSNGAATVELRLALKPKSWIDPCTTGVPKSQSHVSKNKIVLLDLQELPVSGVFAVQHCRRSGADVKLWLKIGDM